MRGFRVEILLLCLIYSGCNSFPELRQMPVFAGVSIDARCGASVVIDNMEVFREYNLTGWMVEFPFSITPRQTGSDFRYYEKHTVDTLVAVFQAEELPYILSFPLSNPHNLNLKNVRIAHYLSDVSGILLRTRDYPPAAIVFSGMWMNPDFYREDFRRFIAELKTSYEGFSGSIVFAGFPYELAGDFDFESPDVIGIRFHEPPEDDLDTYFSQLNREISCYLDEYQKPGMIVHSNLMGERKQELFLHQLSFWPDSVDIQGYALNSLHCEVSLSGRNDFFLWAMTRSFALSEDYLN
ncbi:MAG: hypothetical protein R3C61_12275 [Bacteroidia bacterium]